MINDDKSFIRKEHLAVRRLNYVYNVQETKFIIKIVIKIYNYYNKNVQI